MKFTYTGIRVTDLERSIAFYTKVLGMRVRARLPIPETRGEVVSLRSPGSTQELELNWYARDSPYEDARRPYRVGDGLDHLAFVVDDADRVYRRLISRGVAPAMEPFTEGGWRLAYVKDPDGNWIELGSRIRRRSR